jgi:hypothetical protein
MASRQEQFHYILGCLFQDRKGKKQAYVDSLLNQFLTGDSIDVNQNYGVRHPLLHAVLTKRIAVMRWLLRHPQTVIPSNCDLLFSACNRFRTRRASKIIYDLAIRPEMDLERSSDSTVLGYVCRGGYYHGAVSLIAAGTRPVSSPGQFGECATIVLARQYELAPIITRQRCQLERSDPMISAACLFGLAISIEDYWCYRPSPKGIDVRSKKYLHWIRPQRFFTIVQRLPTELQMLLCRRVYGLNGFNIPSNQLVLPTALLLVASGEYTWA